MTLEILEKLAGKNLKLCILKTYNFTLKYNAQNEHGQRLERSTAHTQKQATVSLELRNNAIFLHGITHIAALVRNPSPW